jgi:hypothetical protein
MGLGQKFDGYTMKMKWIYLWIALLPTTVWAGAFTAISDGFSWQSTNFVNEFYIAIDERSQVYGGGALTSRVEVGDNLQATNVWQQLQHWVEANCDEFVATNITLTGQKDPITNWTWSTLSTHLGINYGWRRATNWDVTVHDWTDTTDSMYVDTGYGQMKYGDIVGPWIFDDLQKALRACDWTGERRSVQSAGTGNVTNWAKANGQGNSITHGTIYAAWTNAVATYSASLWTTQAMASGGYYYQADRYKWYGGTPGRYNWSETRWRSQPLLTAIQFPGGLTYDWDLYLLASGVTGDDMDSTGWAQGHVYLIESDTTVSASNVTAALYGTSATQPFDASPTNNWQGDWPTPPGGDRDQYDSYVAWWVLKWNFTYE